MDDYDDRFQKFRRANRPSWLSKPSNDTILVALSVIVVALMWFVIWILER